jgi:REP element-mobilizing transposase RayT
MRERKRQRLAGYDYTGPGAYFATVCVYDRECLLGDVVNGEMVANKYGNIVVEKWLDLPNHYTDCELDEYIVMPNHFHGIIVLRNEYEKRNGLKPFPTENDNECAIMPNNIKGIIMPGDDNQRNGNEQRNGNIMRNGLKPFPTKNGKKYGLPEIMRGFKTFSSRAINAAGPDAIFRWQKSYYDRIIRNEEEMNRIRQYIQMNPLNWETDRDAIDLL